MPAAGNHGLNQTVPTMTRIAIDTSSLLPALTSPRPTSTWIVRLVKSPAITLIGNRETDDELQRKLREHYAPNHGITAYIPARRAYQVYDQYRAIVAAFPTEPTPQCLDPDDQIFIDLAYAGAADFLLTRDDKLLAIDSRTPFRIIDDREGRHVLTIG